MKFLRISAAALVTGVGCSIAMAQNASATAAAQANAAVSDRYLTPVETELAGKLDSKNATVGQPVSAKTTETAKLADGTTLPRGTRLDGHVTQVQAHSKDQPYASLAIVFDRAELKDGQSVALRAVMRTLAPPATLPSPSDNLMADGPMGPGGGASAGSRGAMGLGGSTAGSAVHPVQQTAGSTLGGPVADTRSIVDATANPEAGAVAHAGDSVSAAPRATGLPGVMLSNAAGADASGRLMASGKNISLDSGTRITLAVIVR